MSDKIRLLNDTFRLDPLKWGRLMTTAGLNAKGQQFANKAVMAARTFDAFTRANDPHGEHDFASFDVDGTTCFFKIDCYDKNLQYGSPDPEDPTVTTRVMTVALMSEY